ncbi:UDP-N-acetylmuramoyl-L-alanine--D-glutamate ligase [soil metagenome]
MSGSWPDRTVLVTGAGLSGTAAARALFEVGADVVLADRDEPAGLPGVRFIGTPGEPPAGVDLVVTSPGWRPDHPLLVAAAARGVPVIGEVELAWRLRGPHPAPWLAVTGTNGKTTTVRMLESMLRAGGRRAVAAGNVGLPLTQAVRTDPPYDVLAVELSSFQLHWSRGVVPHTAVLLNLAEDHLDWHGSMSAYAAAKARIYPIGTIAVHNADDPWSLRLAPVGVGITVRRRPERGQLGIEDGQLVDRAFGDRVSIAAVGDLAVPGLHNIVNALGAAALARSYRVPPEAVRAGLRSVTPGPHRNILLSTVDGVSYVDDSKATNPHAAAASLAAFERVVWIAGGLLKGARVDDLVAGLAGRLVGVVLLGADRGEIAGALARHAPDVPVTEVLSTDDGAMDEVVRAAARLARSGDTVLLAPAAASMDMFTDYAARGRAFAAAVSGLTRG